MINKYLDKTGLFYIAAASVYLFIAFVFSKPELMGDEDRYLMFAENLSNGFYSPANNLNLWNGPGYPLILMPIFLFNLPIKTALLINVISLLFSIRLLEKTLQLYNPLKTNRILLILFSIYIPFFQYLIFILSEIFSLFLISLFIYHFCNYFAGTERKKNNLYLAGISLGFLVLTKIIFAYVVIVGVIISFFIWIIKRDSRLIKVILISAISLIIVLPYMLYTYNLTGKIFYLGNSGGSSLYWMSSPYENELGDWHSWSSFKKNEKLNNNHSETYNEIKKIYGVERDQRLKEIAINNIKENPQKFIKNWIANISRMLFSYPFSYTQQKISTLVYIIPNSFILVFVTLLVILSIKKRSYLNFETIALMVFIMIYLGGSSLLSAYARFLFPLIPIIFVWAGHYLSSIKIMK